MAAFSKIAKAGMLIHGDVETNTASNNPAAKSQPRAISPAAKYIPLSIYNSKWIQSN